MDDRWITLYNKEKGPVLKVQLSAEGYEKYKNGEKWDHNWIEAMLDITRIFQTEF